MSLLIRNGKVLTMADTEYETGCVLVKNGKISRVAKEINASADMDIIDATGCVVMPGIIDAHCHIGISEQDMYEGDDDTNEATDPVTPHFRAIDAINPMDSAFKDAVRGGITGVMTGPGSANVIGGQFVFMKPTGASVDDMTVLEPAALKIAFGENPKRVYGEQKKTPSTRMGVAAILRDNLTAAINYKDKKRHKPTEFEKDLKKEAFIPVLEGKIPLKAHAHRSDDILTAIRIAKEFNVKITLDHCTEGHYISEYIKESGYPAIVGPSLTGRSKLELKHLSFKTPGILAKTGIKIAIATDHPVIPIQYLPICAGLAVREGLDAGEALKAITINAAEICGVADKVGSLEPGKDADIAIFDGNPLEVLTKVKYTIINGKVQYSGDNQ
ncbi:MAG: amidohydrolase [Firmicutes bacterium]|nr:amidohydrolase [Bacillota bacterium]